MAGLHGVSDGSGQYQGKIHLAKRGRAHARQVAYQAAVAAIAHDGPARGYYHELRQRLAPKAALIALACQRSRIAWRGGAIRPRTMPNGPLRGP
jgi:transposase